MRCITKEKTALFIPNAIAIITSKKEYIFRSFWDREDAFKTLKQCQQDASNTLTQQQQHAAESSPMLEREMDLSSSRYFCSERVAAVGEAAVVAMAV